MPQRSTFFDIEMEVAHVCDALIGQAESGDFDAALELVDVFRKRGMEEPEGFAFLENAVSWCQRASELRPDSAVAAKHLEELALEASQIAGSAMCGELPTGDCAGWAEKHIKYGIIAGNLGNADAMVSVGIAYRGGVGIEKDSEKAIFWFSKAAEMGNADAIICLNEVYHELYGDDWEVYQSSVMERYAQKGFQDAVDAVDALSNMQDDT